MQSDVSTVGTEEDRSRTVDEVSRQLEEAREQQVATSEILRVISTSPTDARPVFTAIAKNAVRLCNAMAGAVFSFDGTLSHFVADFGFTEDALRLLQDEYPIAPRGLNRQALMDRAVVHVVDMLNDPRVANLGVARTFGHRSQLVVPMLQTRRAIGTIVVYGAEPVPFSDAQITLLQTFADQAVIAVENTRLFEAEQASKRELQESLEYQTAISDVLSVISRSPYDLQPVLDTIVQTAARLCRADNAHVVKLKDGKYHLAAFNHTNDELIKYLSDNPIEPGQKGSVAGRAALERRTVHLADTWADPEYGSGGPISVGKSRSVLSVPLLNKDVAIGIITVARRMVEPFSTEEIQLITTFADQAVIAIENARLFEAEQTRSKELRESLEYQTATSQVLNIISRSPSLLQPVFDTIVQTANRLCSAERANIWRLREDKFDLLASTITDPALVAYLVENPIPTGRDSLAGRAVLEGRAIHVPDISVDPELSNQKQIQRSNNQTMLVVPLLREGEPIGVISLARTEVAPFTAKQIELVTTFADQAVIAIENTRLFEEVQARTHELTEALEYQTATSDVLDVISRSPNELQPVLDVIVRTAFALCPSDRALILLREPDGYRAVAGAGFTPEVIRERMQQGPLAVDRGSVFGRVALEGRTIHVTDVRSDPDYTLMRYLVEDDRRTVLGVPLMREGETAGVIILIRTKVDPYTRRQIELVETFADQAVIAMNNARLFEELQARTAELSQSLEYQTAMSEVLGVISRSPSQLHPVLETIAKTARRLCEADRAIIWRLEKDKFLPVAREGIAPSAFDKLMDEQPLAADRTTVAGRAVLENRAVHIKDFQAEPELTKLKGVLGDPRRTMLGVPLFSGAAAIGAIVLTRTEVKPFDQRQIDLVTTFADQAVIAIENTRLFEEVQARTSELQEALVHQTGTADVLKVISRSAFDLQAVLDTLVQSVATLCEADMANIWRPKDGAYRLAASFGVVSQHQDWLAMKNYLGQVAYGPGRGSIVGRTLEERAIVQIEDIRADPEYDQGAVLAIEGLSTFLGVPLLREGSPIGVMVLVRSAVRPFSTKQIELVETFADQAVIAIENARLFEEVQARTRELETALERQTASSEILSVISSSPGTLKPVFDAILMRARELCGAKFGHLILFDGEEWRAAALQNVPSAYAEFWERGQVAAGLTGTLLERLVKTGRPYQAEDARLGPAYRARAPIAVATVELAGARTLLGVPLLKDSNVIGAIVLYRTEVRLFDDQQIALLSSFAAQAVIAIENARLLADLQERQQELARSVEELKSLGDVNQAVNASLELDKVLPTILKHACDMAYASGGTIYEFEKATGEFNLTAGHNMSEEHIARVRAQPIRLGDPGVGQSGERREAVQIADIDAAEPSPMLDILRRTGVRAVLSVPLLHQGELIGALAVRRNRPGAFSPEIIRLLESFAAQSAIAVHNARLFKEVEDKGRQLALANQHKSQFVANMSHELRTPLAAILGYAELLKEGIYGGLPEKSTPIVARIQSNGTHLLGLINTVLDLSKIEAGQFTLNLSEYALDSMVETVRVATKSLAETKRLALKTDVAKSLPIGLGDEQRLTQVLLNLVGNAIKFTDAGEVRIAAAVRGGRFAVAVTDTGPGVPAEEQQKIFEEFHQVDNSNTKKKGGTGLGLAIAKQIVEMHGGRIWVKSSPGKGSTFRMEFPVRAPGAKDGAA